MTSVSADWVIPVDGPPLQDGFVAWEGGRITAVGSGRGERHFESSVILPGLVNAHSHLEYAVYAGFGDGKVFGDWLGLHIARKRALEHEHMVDVARRGAADSLAAGITTTADYSFSGASSTAAAELGLRALVYLEIFGSDPERTARDFENLRSRASETELVRIGISPHAPYTCSVEVYRWCLSLGIPVGTHLAESAAEHEWLVSGSGPLAAIAPFLVEPTGSRALATLEPVLGRQLLCAHCVHLTAAEIALLGSRDVPVAHCPRSNALLGCGIAPLADLRAAGLRVDLGTDSPASTPSFDVWEELRTAVYMSRAREGRSDALEAADALALATLDAARAIGLGDSVGSLTEGKNADLIVLSLAGTPYDPIEDPAVAAVFGGSPAGILETVVDGTTRYRQGETAWQEVRSTASSARRRMLQ